jgi:hypothetical protein
MPILVCACGCGETFEATKDPRKVYKSSVCRKRAHDAAVRAGKVPLPHRRPPEPEHGARVRTVPILGPARLGYLDPPYPGRAHLYPEGREVDHAALIADAVARCPDGWALSTGSTDLRQVLPLCPAGVRVASWHRQARPYLERPYAWEPVIVCGGRRRPGVVVPDALVAYVPPAWDLPGRKPAAFFRWILDLLGAEAGDRIWEPFPGSGAGAEVFLSSGVGLESGTFPAAAATGAPVTTRNQAQDV